MYAVEAALERTLSRFVGHSLARSMVSLSVNWAQVSLHDPKPGDDGRLMTELLKGIKVYVASPTSQRACIEAVEAILADALGVRSSANGADSGEQSDRDPASLTIDVRDENDVVLARSRGRDVSRAMGFSASAQIKLATAISELARNMVQYAGGGTIKILRLHGDRDGVEVEACDSGPGIRDTELVMSTRYRSQTGMGMGLKGAKRLADEFALQSCPGAGTRVVLRKYLDHT